MFPENIVAATFQQVQTKYVNVTPVITPAHREKNFSLAPYIKATVEPAPGMNVLGITTLPHYRNLLFLQELLCSVLELE